MDRRVRPHPLTESKYFDKYTCRNDLMHCLDHHGVWGSVFGSAVWFVVYNDGVPSLIATQQQRLDVINQLLAIRATVLPKIEQQPLALASGFIDVVTKIEKTLFEPARVYGLHSATKLASLRLCRG